MKKMTICLLNDSFPPQIDGVANAVVNYAAQIKAGGAASMVVTPAYPQSDDSRYPFPVYRYPSIPFPLMEGYMAGIPFSPEIARQVTESHVSLLHSHCPVVSTFMARELRQLTDAPVVLTYHTKFDIDIANIIRSKQLQSGSKKALLENINACDEVWTVSRGAGENLRSLGFEGDYVVMPNGVDLARGRSSAEQIAEVKEGYDIPGNVPVYLFVGRLMWYKGIRIIVDALAQLLEQGRDFRMVFVGSGGDEDAIRQYALQAGVGKRCVFTGPIRDRETLRAWYSGADLFLFPSTFDTNGLVVREAAACDLAAVLVRGSCAAEDVTDGRNAFLIDETADSLAACLLSLYDRQDKTAEVGMIAGSELYISWEDAVKRAMERYEIVIDRYRSGSYPNHRRPIDELWKANAELMERLAKLSALMK